MSWFTDMVQPGIDAAFADTQLAKNNSAASTSIAKGVNVEPNGFAVVSNSADSAANAYNQSLAWLREDMIRREGYKREDEAYTRLFNELKSLGVNPALLLSSVGPTVGSAGGNSAASFKTSNYAETERANAANSAKNVGSILAAVALIIGALIAAA